MAKLKLTSELQEKICAYLAEGCTHKAAFMAVGIDKSTFYKWLQFGERTKSGIYKDFFDAVKKAEGEAYAFYVSALKENSRRGNAMSIIFWLQNRHGDEWQDKRHFEHDGKIEIVFTKATEKI